MRPVRSPCPALPSRPIQPQIVDPPVQVRPVEPQFLRRERDVALMAVQGPLDQVALHGLSRFAESHSSVRVPARHER